jgi:hypothetical protein
VEKLKSLYNKLTPNQILHLKTVGWIVGVLFAIWFVVFMFVNFTDFMVLFCIGAVLTFFAYTTYMSVYTLIKIKSRR